MTFRLRSLSFQPYPFEKRSIIASSSLEPLPAITSTSSSSSPSRYTLQSCGDQYVRWELPKFPGHRYLFGNDTDPTSESTHKIQSVVENVQILDQALQEHAVGQDPFGEVWQNAIRAYADDLDRSIRPLIFGPSPTAVFRNSIVTMAKCKAQSELREFVTKRPIGQVALGHGWVFFLLETYLGETLRRYHKSLPEDSGDYDEEFAMQLLEEAHYSFEADKSVVTSSIQQIRSSWRLGQAVQFFDMAGGELEVKRQGLLPKEGENTMNTSRVPGDHGSYLDLSVCLPEATRSTSSHDAIIVLGQEMWEMASAGLGAGYVT